MESYIVQQDFSAAFDRVSHSGGYSNWHLLVYVTLCCPFVGCPSPTAGRESWLMMLPVNWSQSFLACHREVWSVLFCLSYIPVKCLRGLRTHYIQMQMTPHYWQLSASQETDLLLLPPLTAGDFAIIQEWCNHWWMILNPNKTKVLVVSGSRTVNPPYGDLVLSGVAIRDSPNLGIIGVKLTAG